MTGAPDLSSVLAGEWPRKLPANFKMACAVLVGIGVLAAGYGFATDATRAGAAFLINFLYFAGVAQGAFMLAIALMITQGRWGRPLKRIAEGFGLFFPVMWVFLILFLVLGGINVYPWTHADHLPLPPHKAVWLTPGFFIMRQVVGMGLLIVLSLLFTRASLRADLGAIKADVPNPPAWWGRLMHDWRGVDAEREEGVKRQMTLAPIVAMTYAMVFSLMSVDVSMSLAPHWFANMFPAWYFMSCFWSGLVWLAIYSLLARDWLGITHLLTPKLYHDLGKLTFGLTMFWGYTTFAQYLAIWYSNMTEETGFILLRTELQPWAPITKAVVFLCFLVPFGMLVNRSLKKMPSAYLAAASVLAVGIWMERFIQVMPSVWLESTFPLPIVEVGMAMGFLGAMLWTVTRFLSEVPPVPVEDPWMAPHPEEVHVHPSSHAGAH